MEVLTVIEHRRAILDITRAAGMIHMPDFNVFDFTLRNKKERKKDLFVLKDADASADA